MKILWASPLPPARTGVSDYAVELLSALADRARVRVVSPPGWRADSDWPVSKRVEVVATDAPAVDGERTLVHLGNNPHHAWLLPRLADPRAVAVLHDLVLHHLLVEVAAGATSGVDLAERLQLAHGASGRAVARARRYGLTGPRDPFLLPARAAFLSNSLRGVVVHSEWGRSIVQRELAGVPCARIAMPAVDPGTVDRATLRSQLGFSEREVVLMHLGFMTPEKGLEAVLAGLATAIRCGTEAHLLLVGEGGGAELVLEVASRLEIRDHVQRTGWIDRDRFLEVPAAADLGIVLRSPSAGETSAAVVRFLACGTPAAVVGLHQFLEWPLEAAPRITPGPSAPAELARLLTAVASDDDAWSRRRRSAREAYESCHRPQQAASQLLDFLASTA